MVEETVAVILQRYQPDANVSTALEVMLAPTAVIAPVDRLNVARMLLLLSRRRTHFPAPLFFTKTENVAAADAVVAPLLLAETNDWPLLTIRPSAVVVPSGATATSPLFVMLEAVQAALSNS